MQKKQEELFALPSVEILEAKLRLMLPNLEEAFRLNEEMKKVSPETWRLEFVI